MKKIALILAMMLIAATSYNQSSRKTTNANRTVEHTDEKSKKTTSGSNTGNQKNDRSNNSSKETRTHNNDRKTTNSNTNTATQRTNTTTESNTGKTADRTAERNQNTTNTTNSNQRTENRHVTTTTDNNTRNTSDRTAERNQNTTNTTNSNQRTENRHSTNPTNTNTTSHANRSNNANNTGTVNRPATREYSSPRVYTDHHPAVHSYHRPPKSREYRSRHYAYRAPVSVNFVWTPVVHSHFIRIYPMVNYWEYHDGYCIETISAYDALYYRGSVMTVYGKISEVFYSRATDEYFFYFGPFYPYQDFTVVMSGWIARRYSTYPSYFFDNQYIAVTGLITSFEGNPEMVVKEDFQINIY